MNLTTLFTSVAAHGTLPTSRLKDVNTSLRYLARALGRPNPEECQLGDYWVADWKTQLNAYLDRLSPAPSAHTVRNTRNNLSTLFRHAEALQLLTPLDEVPQASALGSIWLMNQEMIATSPYRQRVLQMSTPRRVPLARWPRAIRTTWEAFCRERRLTLRPITLANRTALLERYLGFLANVANQPARRWADVFDLPHLQTFLHWHTQAAGVRMTTQGYITANYLGSLARMTQAPNTAALLAYCQGLPRPEPMHSKQEHWITLRELEQVGLHLLARGRRPAPRDKRSVRYGARRTQYHQLGLILRLLVRVPLRQRNIREMQLGRNLYQDDQGHWQLTFVGAELKVSERKGRTNRFTVNLSTYAPDLLPHLEEFLRDYRPCFLNGTTSPLVFVTERGHPYTGSALAYRLQSTIYAYTRKRVYPHLIRTIWATEFISRTRDFTTAAYMLNDRVETVINRYQEILEKDHAEKASIFLKGTFTG